MMTTVELSEEEVMQALAEFPVMVDLTDGYCTAKLWNLY